METQNISDNEVSGYKRDTIPSPCNPEPTKSKEEIRIAELETELAKMKKSHKDLNKRVSRLTGMVYKFLGIEE